MKNQNIFVVETGCLYEGGNVRALFDAYEKALVHVNKYMQDEVDAEMQMLMDCYEDDPTIIPAPVSLYKKEERTENYQMWVNTYGYYISIRKMEVQ